MAMAAAAAAFWPRTPLARTAPCHPGGCSSSGRHVYTVPNTPRLQWQEQGRTVPRSMLVLRRCTTGLELLDLTEENVERALLEARTELLQLFDSTVGITGVAELVELDGPFVTLRLRGRFWHQRSMVLARLASFLRKRIPEVLEVNIEDPSQLDDSASNF